MPQNVFVCGRHRKTITISDIPVPTELVGKVKLYFTPLWKKAEGSHGSSS